MSYLVLRRRADCTVLWSTRYGVTCDQLLAGRRSSWAIWHLVGRPRQRRV